MQTIGAYEAKTHLPELLRRVADGEEFTITRHGVPVAQLVPLESKRKRDVDEVIEKLLEFGKGRKLGDLTIREMIDEGRRY